MFGFRKIGTLELIGTKIRRRQKEIICFFIVIITVDTVWKHGRNNLFETKFVTFYPTFTSAGSNLLNVSSIVLKNKAMLDNHSYSDGFSSLFYHEGLLLAEKRTIPDNSKDKTKTILVWTWNWNAWNELPK